MTDTTVAKRNCFPGFHRWTKWEQYIWSGKVFGSRYAPTDGAPVTERRQKRHCVDCGREQDELVRNG